LVCVGTPHKVVIYANWILKVKKCTCMQMKIG
jgi:hypothetical protein